MIEELKAAAAYGIVYCLDSVPVRTQTLVDAVNNLTDGQGMWISILDYESPEQEEILVAFVTEVSDIPRHYVSPAIRFGDFYIHNNELIAGEVYAWMALPPAPNFERK